MPIYEYVCSACKHRVDMLHGINEQGPAFCPSCGAEGTMRKAFLAPTVHFKGSGWAKKERRSGSATKASASRDSDRHEKGEGGSDTSSSTPSSADGSASDRAAGKPSEAGAKPAVADGDGDR